MGRIGGGELLIILVIALLIFGPSKLADMGKGLGQGLKNFKKGLSHDGEDDDDAKPAVTTTVAMVPETPQALTAGTPITGEATAPIDETASGVPHSPK